MPVIFQLNCTSNWGSTGKIAEQIGEKALDAGWECYLAFGRYSNPSAMRTVKVGNMFWTLEHYVEGVLLDKEGLSSRISTKRLLRIFDSVHPDLVHLHNIHDHWMNYQMLFQYLAKKRVPVVWTLHDCWPFTGHCYHFVSVNCERWKTGCFSCPQRNKTRDCSQRNWNLKKSLFASHPNLTVVPVSQWMGDFVKQSFFKDKRIEVIHNGVDMTVFQPQRRAKYDRFMILAVSNVWNESKGIIDIYELRRLLPPEDYDIIVVGLTAEQVKSAPEGIIGIQRTQNVRELVRIYSDADVFINPTYADTFPTVNIESLACGTPVITYKTGGSPEAVDEKTGAVVEQGDLEGLCAKIQEFKTVGFKQQHSTDCRKRAEEHFDKDKCFEKYVELYESLLS